MAAVTLNNVTKKFGGTVAVDSLNLAIENQEFVVLLGPSGCGKTTTLNMVAGLENVTGGHIMFDGEPVEHLPPDKRDIAMVFQSIALYPHMTVYANIAFPLKMSGVSRHIVDERVRATANLMGIGDLLDRKPHQLSGGQRQRVALGRSIVRNPAVFLFDEPLSALDAKLRVDMRVEIKKLHERLGATFVYVTHDQVEALTMADRIAIMDGGRLLQYSNPDAIYQRPANMFVARFVGSPGMNFLPGRVRQAKENWWFDAKRFSLPLTAPIGAAVTLLEGPEATLGIRPERVLVNDADHGSVTGWVYATEPVGSDLFISVSFDDSSAPDLELFKVRTPPNLSIRSGDRVPLTFPFEHIFLFDRHGHRIYPVDREI